MGEPKPLASLSSGLLARKGQAAPAMRRQSMLLSASDNGHHEPHNPLEDLGWNDMGGDDTSEPSRSAKGLSPMPTLAPVPSLVPASAAAPAETVVPMPISPAVRMEPAEVPEVVRQQENLAREVAPPAEVAPAAQVAAPEPVAVTAARKAPRALPGSRGKAAFTLRLDADRHLKLRLVCAVSHRSAQQVVTQALDAFLASQPSMDDFVKSQATS